MFRTPRSKGPALPVTLTPPMIGTVRPSPVKPIVRLKKSMVEGGSISLNRSPKRRIFDDEPPTTAERLIRVLDAMPASVAALERRPPWAEAVKHYARMVSQALPPLQPRLDWMSDQIMQGLEGCPEGEEPTHGDFHEGQIHVRNGHVSGILDIDTVGPGRRADDLACLVAHLSTVQRMNARQAERVHHLLRTWVPVFDERVDPTPLRGEGGQAVGEHDEGSFLAR